MNLNFTFTVWDLLLLVLVTLMGTLLAYLHHPKWKAFILGLPIPFTLASLSLGQEVVVTHVLGLPMLILYANAVRWLYRSVGLPILPAILLAAGSYAVLGVSVASVVPETETVFWVLVVGMLIVSGFILRIMPHREEPGHRTPLPVWIKIPMIAGVILCLIIGKKVLQGLMTTFPMVGLVAAYEGRHSLWTMCRTVAAFQLWIIPMMATVHVAQPHIGLGSALVLGWLVYLSLMIPMTLRHWRMTEQVESV